MVDIGRGVGALLRSSVGDGKTVWYCCINVNHHLFKY